MKEDMKVEEINENVSRRDFFVKAGALATGMAVAGLSMGSIFSSEAEAYATLPLPYKPINTQKVLQRGFDGYYIGGCMYGAAYALISTIRESFPAGADQDKWNQIPLDMFRYGAGGINSWGTLCGALNSSIFVITLVAGATNNTPIGNDLLNWYCKFPFPSRALDTYAASTGHNFPNQINTISESPLCHVSVSKWSEASGGSASANGIGSNAKKARCAKLTGLTAARTADLLNKYINNKFVASTKWNKETDFCMSCHTTTADTTYRWGQGKMYCGECHDPKDNHNHSTYGEDCTTCHK